MPSPATNSRCANITSVSELKLNLPNTNETKKRKSNQLPPKTQHRRGDSKTASLKTISLQNLDMTAAFHTHQPHVKVQRHSVQYKHPVEESKSTPLRRHGYDFSSSNSPHDGWVVPIPRKFKRKCSVTTSSEPASSSLRSTVTPIKQPEPVDLDTSQEMQGTAHKSSKKQVNFKGAEWKAPCKESFVAGAPRAYIGTCPPHFEDLVKMSKPRQKFFLTQDPRKTYCLHNPDMLRRKAYSTQKEFNALSKMVKQADNICAASASESSESFICDVIDLENPMQLDFQGLDYKNTFEVDEQDVQNQRIYRRVCRHMERERVKSETQENVEKEQQQERLNVPKVFEVVDRNDEVSSETTVESVWFGKLFRSADKPYNKRRIAEEHERREERYKDLYLRRKERDEKQQLEAEEEAQRQQEQIAITLAERDFKKAVDIIDDAIQRSFKKERMLRRNEIQRRIYPHTLRETVRYKRTLKARDRMLRDKARITTEFYKERQGKDKVYPSADLEISSDTPVHSSSAASMSEQSSDDEDEIQVGKDGQRFKLRGFQFQLGDGLRGKRHQTEQTAQGRRRNVKGCMTREEWLAELAPKKTTVKLDVELGIEKVKLPDDPELVLFRPPFGFKVAPVETSAVRAFREKRLGRHYDRILRKKLKLVKPKLHYSVKKFNLINFLYGDDHKKEMADFKKTVGEQDQLQLTFGSTLEYIAAKDRMKKQRQEIVKQKRLVLLGIPCKEVKKSRLQTLCENSDSDSDSDWVPQPEPEMSDNEERIALSKSIRVPMRQRGNMPAPNYRETTLRRHPRHPRNYYGDRVPSQLFDETVKKTGIPHMHKLPIDIQQYENVRLKKRPYTDIFHGRHHYDHWNPTQLKIVDVHYQAQIVTADITKVKRRCDKPTIENFREACPPCNAYINMDLTMPQYDIDGMIDEYTQKSKHKTTEVTKERTRDICHPHDFVYHSRSAKEQEEFPDFPGHKEYLDFLQEIRLQLHAVKDSDDTQEKLYVDREALVKELEEDLKSIESCLTSLESSECTNLTNDSGSFLLMEGTTKVPMDYIRRSIVPFEELQRSRFRTDPIDVDAEDANPFNVLPFPGQKKAQLELTTGKDTFFTFNTRLQNGLRLRLEIPVEDIRTKLLGRGANKYPGIVSTDIDENYVIELKNRPPVKMFNFKTGRSVIKDALRLKFESMLIQGQIVRTKIYDRLNEQHWAHMQMTKTLYEKLFAKWEKKEYETSMAVVYQVKTYYDITDTLKREFREVEREQMLLNMDIVYIEGDWIRRLMLQNFHYLLADQDWRIKNDWIHRVYYCPLNAPDCHVDDDEVELESFDVSIAKRTVVNVRQREKDDAWAIKKFYTEQYLKNKHPILIVFPDAESFLKGIENLKTKTFVLLLELHFTLSIHTELQGRLETFVEWCAQDLIDKEDYVARKCAKKYFMSDRAEQLRAQTLHFLEGPIEQSYNDEAFNRDRAVVAEVWRQIVPANIRGAGDQELQPIDLVAMMSDVVLELISKFETISVKKARRVEGFLRKRHAYLCKQSYQAYQVEKRIEIEMKKVRKNLEPPYVKPKRVGKLPRTYIKKKIPVVVIPEKHISEHTKFFFRAFHDEGDVMQTVDARESLFVMDTIQEQIVPFYFDYFLKINGYTPNYNFRTQIDMRDGPERERVVVKSVVPEIMQKMDVWELNRKTIMEENITRNPKMYENVNF